MPYCGHFGCRCCSAPCKKCGVTYWHRQLEDGVCHLCISQEELNELKEKTERQRKIITRLCKELKKQKRG